MVLDETCKCFISCPAGHPADSAAKRGHPADSAAKRGHPADSAAKRGQSFSEGMERSGISQRSENNFHWSFASVKRRF